MTKYILKMEGGFYFGCFTGDSRTRRLTPTSHSQRAARFDTAHDAAAVRSGIEKWTDENILIVPVEK